MSGNDYWREAFMTALEDAGVDFPDSEAIDRGARSLMIAHDQVGMAFGYDCIPDPRETEIKDLKRKLTIEESKVVCPECKGKGRLYSQGPHHGSDTECFKCRGQGKVVI